MKKQAIITENNMEYLITSGKRGEKKYCLEVNTSIWEPKYPGDICPEYMLRFCRARGLSDLEWYVNLLDEKITKEEKHKTTGEVVKAVQRKRTPSEVKQEFIKKYFPGMKRVKDEDYHGHASKAKKLLEEMKAAQPSPKKSSSKE